MWLWLVTVVAVSLVGAAQDETELAGVVGVSVPLAEDTAASPINTNSRCFNVRPEECPSADEGCLCKNINADSVLCCHVPNTRRLTQALQCAGGAGRRDIRNLHIRNASLSNLENFGQIHLDSLSVTDGRIDNLTTVLLPNLSCLNLSSNSIPDMVPNILHQLRHLQTLDLSMNNLTRLPELMTNLTIDISGNQMLGCQTVMQFLELYPKVEYLHEDITFCISSSNFTWFKSTDRVQLSQIKSLMNIKESCPTGCICEPHRLVMVPGKSPTFAVSVNCSAMGLQKLPDNLPPNVVALNVSYNNITSLDALIEDKMYEDIQEFYADSNQISSILALEGSKFIDNFQVLSLRENHIKSLPLYILSNMFDRNNNERRVNLGWNRLTCNCSVAQVVKMWLLTNKKHVPDYDQVVCDNPADKNTAKVIELDQNKVCVYPRDWTDYIYYIIAGEVGLLFLLVGKVSYDYWVFKTAGYLPWPASKMPKLPCDWVFE